MGEPSWVWSRLGLLDSNQSVVGLLGSVERCFELGGRHVAAVAVQTGSVVPMGPAGDSESEVGSRSHGVSPTLGHEVGRGGYVRPSARSSLSSIDSTLTCVAAV